MCNVEEHLLTAVHGPAGIGGVARAPGGLRNNPDTDYIESELKKVYDYNCKRERQLEALLQRAKAHNINIDDLELS